MHSLGNEESAIARGPVLSSEKCKSTQLLATPQAMIPERLQKVTKAQVKAEGSTIWENAMIIATNLHTDQLELAGAQLEDTVQSLVTEEAEEWNGFPDSDEGRGNTELTEVERRRILEQMDEQSGNIKAFEKALANAENRRLWIGNLDPTATAVELEGIFSGYNVENITFPPKRKRIRQRYSFVILKNADEVGRAICELSG